MGSGKQPNIASDSSAMFFYTVYITDQICFNGVFGSMDCVYVAHAYPRLRLLIAHDYR